MGWAPNHPKLDHFSIETHVFFGSPIPRISKKPAYGSSMGIVWSMAAGVQSWSLLSPPMKKYKKQVGV